MSKPVISPVSWSIISNGTKLGSVATRTLSCAMAPDAMPRPIALAKASFLKSNFISVSLRDLIEKLIRIDGTNHDEAATRRQPESRRALIRGAKGNAAPLFTPRRPKGSEGVLAAGRRPGGDNRMAPGAARR